MKYSKVFINSIAYQMAPDVVTSADIESRLTPLYKKWHIPMGQFAALTGIQERRWWPEGFIVSEGAIQAARKAIEEAGVAVEDLGAVIYTGVCRDLKEPATACRIASDLGAARTTAIHDISNACLGFMSGILDVANRIELGQIKAGLVVACESARDIVNIKIEDILSDPTMENYANSLATLTLGSGAAAAVLTDGSLSLTTSRSHRLMGAGLLGAPEHSELCRWGSEELGTQLKRDFMYTDAINLLKEGVGLAVETWHHFLGEMDWTQDQMDKAICHQVGAANRKQVLTTLDIPFEKDYPTYPFLGNMGTVSLPMTAGIAYEEGFLKEGDNVGFMGIGSGLNCMMLGLKW